MVYADGDGTVDVQMTDRFGERWFMYRAREGWPGVIIGETFRNSGVLRPTALPSWHYAEHPLWYQRVLEADYILGRRGTQGWDGQEEDRGVLIRNLAEEETDRDENWRDWAWGMIKGIGKALAVLALSLLVFATGGLAMFVLIGLAAVSLAASIGHRIAQGQTVGQVIGGSLADLTGVSGVYAGITGKDIATGEDLGLSYEQRGEMFGQGLIQVAATAIGAYKGIRGGIRRFRAWRQARRATRLQAQALGSGARSWKWGHGQIGDDVAESAYQVIRESGTDVAAISRYTGYKPSRLQRIKNYLFNNPEWTGADGEIAAGWHRLRTGRGTAMDRLLLKHETAEMWFRRRILDSYRPAHQAANRHWNWETAVEAATEGAR